MTYTRRAEIILKLGKAACMKSNEPVVRGRMSFPPAHAHYFGMKTSVQRDHDHFMEGFTYPVNGHGYDGHRHTYQGHTKISHGHFHRYLGKTGPAIPLPSGQHYHELQGEVDEEPFQFKKGYYLTLISMPGHTHAYQGPSGPGIGYERFDEKEDE